MLAKRDAKLTGPDDGVGAFARTRLSILFKKSNLAVIVSRTQKRAEWVILMSRYDLSVSLYQGIREKQDNI